MGGGVLEKTLSNRTILSNIWGETGEISSTLHETERNITWTTGRVDEKRSRIDKVNGGGGFWIVFPPGCREQGQMIYWVVYAWGREKRRSPTLLSMAPNDKET